MIMKTRNGILHFIEEFTTVFLCNGGGFCTTKELSLIISEVEAGISGMLSPVGF